MDVASPVGEDEPSISMTLDGCETLTKLQRFKGLLKNIVIALIKQEKAGNINDIDSKTMQRAHRNTVM